MWGYKQRLSIIYRQATQSVGLCIKNGEGGIRTLSQNVAKARLAPPNTTSNKQGLSVDPLSFPQVLLVKIRNDSDVFINNELIMAGRGKGKKASSAKRTQVKQKQATRASNRATAAANAAARQANQAAAQAKSSGGGGGSSSSHEDRQHDASMQQQGHMNAVQLQQLQAQEGAKQREFEREMAAKERAQGYIDNNMKKPQGYQGQDFTGGAVDKYAGKFASNGNSYKGKGFQEFDFRTESRADKRKRRRD